MSRSSWSGATGSPTGTRFSFSTPPSRCRERRSRLAVSQEENVLAGRGRNAREEPRPKQSHSKTGLFDQALERRSIEGDSGTGARLPTPPNGAFEVAERKVTGSPVAALDPVEQEGRHERGPAGRKDPADFAEARPRIGLGQVREEALATAQS